MMSLSRKSASVIAAFALFTVFFLPLAELSELQAQEPEQLAPIITQEHKPIEFTISTSPKEGWDEADEISSRIKWNKSPSLTVLPAKEVDTYHAWAPVGTHTVTYTSFQINWTKKDFDEREFIIFITVESADPQPDPSPDPKPDPDPQPAPGPDPFQSGTSAAPFNGIKLLLVEEQTERDSLPAAQRAIYQSQSLWDYITSKSVVGPNNYSEWRILDKDTTFSTDNQWKRAMDVALRDSKKRFPDKVSFWIIISNGKTWGSYPLPPNVDEMRKLIDLYAL